MPNSEPIIWDWSLLLQEVSSRAAPVDDGVRRLFHGRGHCFSGLEAVNLDALGRQWLLTFYREVNHDELSQLSDDLLHMAKQFGGEPLQSLLVQRRYLPGAPTEVLWGEFDSKPVVTEQGACYQLELGKQQNSGLFLDMANGRRWIAAHAEGKRVLNLFAYTCAFSVAAMKAGAQRVVNLDMSQRSLQKGWVNHRLSDLDLGKVEFLAHDLFKSWGKLKRKGPYDIVVVDPPSFQKGSFEAERHYSKVIDRLPGLLSSSSDVLLCLNDPDLGVDFISDRVAQSPAALDFVERIETGPDFPEQDTNKGLKILHYRYQGDV
ncbi:class I SAM-dependent methyltransferase [Aestuariirhabdus sp. Z084]|uniref:class I SAM-dependent methyltransferase n=1 Tax=Aestuariirhabdus haliotis TaxID=2918751 RepID=UPI00201B442C|nr:class I SAM-dependent methyltransferase [Aestuariirhabdus haliotis]MCL6416153.1 class I SAM-dependent methyltransferase [Aestuariirhabdus haliotis]MCL6420090.1 class I SAM-dependent methyltransferase [Aestuariirhabdus haliotis]